MTCWLYSLIILIEDSDYSNFFRASFLYLFGDINMLIVLIDPLTCLSIVTLILPWLFCSLHMYRFIVVYRLTWWVDSLACILSWLSLSMMFVSSFILIVIASAWPWVIYPVYCLTVCCMTTLLLHDCMSPVYVGRISIPLPPTLLVSVIPFIPVLIIASVRPSMCLLSDRARD